MSAAGLSNAVVLALALGLASPARAELVDLKWNGDRFAHKASIAPKKFLEVCGKLKKGENIGWQFSGSAPTDFNIHYHVGKDVVYPAKREDVSTARDSFAVPLDQDYCWMWSNKGAQA
ncbi:MAG: hypothetical protein ABI790_13755, partial [Betaproteobacteria bacterium]